MKLSEIDTSVYYPITIPSTKKKTTFRPFRVREEKALLTAQESDDPTIMLSTLSKVVRDCLTSAPEDLTTFDVEFIFTQLRAKSVGEISSVLIDCANCQEKNNVDIDLTKTIITNPKQNKKLKLSNELTVVMRYPSLDQVTDLILNAKDTIAIAACIESVYYKDQVFHTKDGGLEEISEFLLNRTDSEMDMIVDFVENIPTVELTVDFVCTACGTKNTYRAKNLADFF